VTVHVSSAGRFGAQSLFARYVAFAARHDARLLAALGVLALAALALALRLELHTDMTELLPADHPAVLALRRVAGHQKSASNLVLLVRSPSADANRAFAVALQSQLALLVPMTFSEMQWQPDSELADFAARQKWLYASLADLQRADALLDRVIARRLNPLWVDLESDPEVELERLWRDRERALPPPPRSVWFEGQIDGQYNLGALLWRGLGGVGTRGDREAMAAVKAAVARADSQRFDPRLRVELTGGIAQAIDEQDGIRVDLTVATIVTLALVLLAIYSYFRRLALLLVIGAPAVLGLLASLALFSATVRHLNLNTAFLISIILGNGINAPIVLLARYGAVRRRDAALAVAAALRLAMTESLPGTLTATAAASTAYGCLLLTRFRGFSQFGLLGGAGMLLVWLATFLLVPPLVLFGERRWPGRLTPRASLWQRAFGWLGAQVERRPWAAAWLTGLVVAAALVPLSRVARDPLEWNLDRLRSDASPSQRLWPTMEALGLGDVSAGHIGNKGVLLVDEPAQADAVAAALKAQDAAKGAAHVLAEVRTLGSMLPSAQLEKLALLAKIRRTLDRHRDKVGEKLAVWRPPDELRPLTIDDLPRQIRDAFTEADGRRGRLIGIDVDRTTYYDWNGHDLLRLAHALQVDALGRHWVAASAVTVFAGMMASVIADGPRLTLAALLCVLLVLLLAFGARGAAPVLTSLAIGLGWLGGAAGALGLKINFMSFVALPITIGVGADYAANLWSRLRVTPERIAAVLADTGAAVALCSLTTIIGYSSLLFSRNRALRSFGLLADLGELTCLVAALVALPLLAGRSAWVARMRS
jgi:predicted exporter